MKTVSQSDVEPGVQQIEINKIRVGILLQQGSIACVTNIVILVLTLIALYSYNDVKLLHLWGTVIFLAILLRLLLVKYLNIYFSKHRNKPSIVSRCEKIYAAGVFLSGLAWGSLGFAFDGEAQFNHQLIIPLVVAGLCSGAIYSMLSSFLSFISYVYPMLICVILAMFNVGLEVEALTLVTYMIACTMLFRNLHASVIESLQLRHENRHLISHLTSVNESQTQLVETLQKKEIFLTQTFENAGFPIFLMSAGLIILDANKAACKLFAYSKTEFKGMNMSLLLHEDECDEASHDFYRLIDGDLQQYQITKRCLSRDNRPLWLIGTVSAVRNTNNKVDYLVIHAQDITEQKSLSEDLQHLALHDTLTGLPNRFAIEKHLQLLLQDTHSLNHIFCYIDVDQFKVINDTCGHKAGDKLLTQIAHIIKCELQPSDILARLSGDEFAAVLIDTSPEQAKEKLNRVMEKIRRFEFVDNDLLFISSISIGMVNIRPDSTMTEIFKQADNACYAAKEAGRDRLHVFSDSDKELVQRSGEMRWVSRIQQALSNDKLILFSQPIAATQKKNSTLPHCELLIRMLDDDGSIIPPGHFLPAAERYNLAASIDMWTVSHVLSRLDEARKAGRDVSGVYGINLSGQSLGDTRFYDKIIELILSANLVDSGAVICFEITETAAISNMHSALYFINELRKVGCLFALDDFGSGLSSFAYLKQLPIDFLKIDGMFVKDCVENSVNLEIVNSINGIGQVLGLKTVAEFVEDEATLISLQHIGVDFVQGYNIGRPEAWVV
ncbi:putative bifunctional diguanylate cyclase/phosphodiesterase [Methylophaga sulfidovorans]|uniref:PAS domain S-box-containing protein/diguanylate cyclase (GGDEF) domain-containing protein n=1 Tax=Methylophaga sulfidovorans TaxID=45496 RepID=A0A1I3ZAS5_9GAMM|nr:EAL domain-containing protein [Methylophaga sulfidovorans]SFK40746.1 PAS domain S-box-containing protein/diguanylate cyclase (GGDEF) domain-containing protein [Methylophaga sulfidovorans]